MLRLLTTVRIQAGEPEVLRRNVSPRCSTEKPVYSRGRLCCDLPREGICQAVYLTEQRNE